MLDTQNADSSARKDTSHPTGPDQRHPSEPRSRARPRQDAPEPREEVLQRAGRVLQPREPAVVRGGGDPGVLRGPGTIVPLAVSCHLRSYQNTFIFLLLLTYIQYIHSTF